MGLFPFSLTFTLVNRIKQTALRMSDLEGDAGMEDVDDLDMLSDEEFEDIPLDPNSALKEVLKKALQYGKLARGLRECVKALDRREALICILASQCDEPAYVDLVKALCKHSNIKLMTVPDNKQLGEWAGLCKLDKDANPRKVVPCSCVVVKEFGKQTEELN